MEKYAEAERYVRPDCFSAMADDKGLLHEELSAVDLRSNTKGYGAMAPLAEAAMLQALGVPALAASTLRRRTPGGEQRPTSRCLNSLDSPLRGFYIVLSYQVIVIS